LLEEAWPEAVAARRQAIEQAIMLAERSALERRVCEGLSEAKLAALMASGRAQIPHLFNVPMEKAEPPPIDRDACVVASLAARVAEKAAETAMASPNQSKKAVWEAFHFAVDTIRAAGRRGLIEVLEADFVAAREAAPRPPWWRFW
jgi:hypothetical protein